VSEEKRECEEKSGACPIKRKGANKNKGGKEVKLSCPNKGW